MSNSQNKNKYPSFTVGITTCYGDASIIETVKSIRGQRDVGKFRFIIVADRVPISKTLKKALHKYKVELIENSTEGSQIKKQKQILEKTDTEILIFTQDDVLYKPYAFNKILRAFANDPKLTMLSVRNQHVKPQTFFEDVINVGTRIANNIARAWNSGDNYLSCVGRCIAMKTSWLKKNITVPEVVATTDAFYYFSNKNQGGKFKYLPDAEVFFRNPQNITEHLRKSSRFQYSEMEMNQYFGDLSKYYAVPKTIAIKAVAAEFTKKPVQTVCYLAVNLYTKINRLRPCKVLNPIWEVDLSTKNISN
jgi:cellulose synthase/poly-beta-1,6-N-acetylglucosamine synthase-like glycosyltransferase